MAAATPHHRPPGRCNAATLAGYKQPLCGPPAASRHARITRQPTTSRPAPARLTMHRASRVSPSTAPAHLTTHGLVS
eukprot:1132182-Prymnesium_polylepis.1